MTDLTGPAVLHIAYGPQEILKVKQERKRRWCFKCRKRLRHRWELLDYSKDSVHWGWYEPVWRLKCSGCNEDNTTFPGVENQK